MRKITIIFVAALIFIYAIFSIFAKGDSVWVFDASSSGGCLRANICGNYTLYDNGEFVAGIGKVNREVGINTSGRSVLMGPVVYHGKIDKSLFKAWIAEASKTEYNAMLSGLDKGRSSASVDGIDKEYKVKYNGRILKILSTKHRFDNSIPFFKLSEELITEMQKQTLLNGKTRVDVQ